jgi:xylulokinase
MKFCGIDVGTSGVKAMVFDERGRALSESSRPYAIQVAPDGTRLLRAVELWNQTKTVFAEAAGKAGGDIDAVCADSFGESFIALDKSDEIICDPMIFTDHWGEIEYREAQGKTGAEEIAALCGLPLSPSYSLSKILYLRDERPGTYEKIARILLIQDFINFMLCGQTAADYSSASRTMFFNVRDYAWSGVLMEKFGLNPEHYSPPVPMGTIIGTVRKSLAGDLGLKDGVKVVVGGHDQPVSAIGAGLYKGAAVNSMGTAECITPIIDTMPPARFIVEHHIPAEPLWEKGKFCCLLYNTTSGLLVDWFLRTVTDEEPLPYRRFDTNIPAEPTGIMVQPYLMGSGTPYMDSGARLAMTGIDYGVTKYDMYRAILEGLCLDQRLNLDILSKEHTVVENLIVVGGGSKSRAWLGIKADILQIPVSIPVIREAGALGCAVLCAAASGIYSTVEEAARSMCRVQETIEPNQGHRSFYDEKFEIYRQLHSHVQEESSFAVRRRNPDCY